MSKKKNDEKKREKKQRRTFMKMSKAKGARPKWS
jgi:hypothetical protein